MRRKKQREGKKSYQRLQRIINKKLSTLVDNKEKNLRLEESLKKLSTHVVCSCSPVVRDTSIGDQSSIG